MSSDQMRQAYELIKQGKKREAVAILQPILKTDRSNADAWWLLANALTEPEKQVQALEQLLRLRPDDGRASRMLERLQEQLRPKVDDFSFDDVDNTVVDDDPFSRSSSSTFGSSGGGASSFSSDDPFMSSSGSSYQSRPPVETFGPPPRQRSSGNNPVVMILAIVGVLALGCCVISAALFARAGGEIGNIFNQIMQTVTADPDVQGFFGTIAAGTPGAAIFDRNSANSRGAIDVGQSIAGNVDTFDDDYYTFSGSAGMAITINVEATDTDLDPQLYVYDSENRLLGMNDDIDMSGGNYDSRLTITLPSNGTYYLVVSAFGSGGRYNIRVTR
ncbi:MAG: pre-peptidase C-terminal domain-containing protein [Anaerolinea sp.]|nr:pre-peptidase C-terminal domain-containing protein [Anaerolinea sp.]